MAIEFTTVSIRPQTAEALREFRDRADGISTMDSAVQELLKEKGE